MISESDSGCSVIGYGKFCELATFDTQSANRWFRSVAAFCVDHNADTKDFRLTRYKRMAIHLIELIEVLDPNRLPSHLQKRRDEIAEGLNSK